MSLPTDQLHGAGELPPLPTDLWWGAHLRETRWQLELYRLLVDPVFLGHGVPHGDGRPVVLMPGFGGGDQTLLVLAVWARGTWRTPLGAVPVDERVVEAALLPGDCTEWLPRPVRGH